MATIAKIWKNRLVASLSGDSDRTFAEVPDVWKEDVKSLLRNDVNDGKLTPEQYVQLVGVEYSEA